VVFTEKLDDDEVRQLGPRIETHAAFPNRTNVQFARVLARDRLEIRIWERGAGWTLASGSSSCAVAAAAVRNDLAGGRLTIQSPGGELGVEVRPDWSIRLRGPVAEACEGTLALELVRALQARDPLPFE
jgi:diaminopimelate epimerase